MAVELTPGRPTPGPDAWIQVVRGESREFRAALRGRTRFGEPFLSSKATAGTEQPRSAAAILQELREITSRGDVLVPPTDLSPVSMDPMRYYDTSLRSLAG